MSHHCFLLHISRMKADRNIISSVPGPLDMSSPWAMSISQTLGGLSEQISPLIAGFCLKTMLFGAWQLAVVLRGTTGKLIQELNPCKARVCHDRVKSRGAKQLSSKSRLQAKKKVLKLICANKASSTEITPQIHLRVEMQ